MPQLPKRPEGQTFAARLLERIQSRGNSVCVGIDPPLGGMPPFFEREFETLGAGEFLERYADALISVAAGKAPAVKFQSAYFEAHGPEGFESLRRSLGKAKRRGLLTILDAKRGDIASTMAAYGRMAFDVMDADALTVTPYMGLDVLEPLLPWLDTGRGAYVVWISSNPSGALLQDGVLSDGFTVAERLLASLLEFEARSPGSIGLVLGATKVQSLAEKTWSQLAATPLLMPGVGAQGGAVTSRIRAQIASSGTVLVPLSRAVAQFPPGCSSWQSYEASVSSRLDTAVAETK